MVGCRSSGSDAATQSPASTPRPSRRARDRAPAGTTPTSPSAPVDRRRPGKPRPRNASADRRRARGPRGPMHWRWPPPQRRAAPTGGAAADRPTSNRRRSRRRTRTRAAPQWRAMRPTSATVPSPFAAEATPLPWRTRSTSTRSWPRPGSTAAPIDADHPRARWVQMARSRPASHGLRAMHWTTTALPLCRSPSTTSRSSSSRCSKTRPSNSS